MARKKDPKIQRFRELALQLEMKGLSPAQISQEKEFASVGADAETVRRWLRAIRGSRPPAAREYRRLKKQGRSRTEIVEELGISEAYSWKLDREIEGPKYVRAKDRVPTFLSDPGRYRFERWAATARFFAELNAHVVRAVADRPATWSTRRGAPERAFQLLQQQGVSFMLSPAAEALQPSP